MNNYRSTRYMRHIGLGALIIILGVFTAASSASAAPDGKITKRSFHYNNYKFWRAGSINAPRIGSYGKKKVSTGIDIHNTTSSKSFEKSVKESGVYTIDFKRLSAWEVSIDDFQYADVKGSGSVERARQTGVTLKLVYLTVDNGPLIDALNKDSKAKAFMKKSNARVVSSIWVVVSAEVADTIRTAGKLSVRYTANGIKLTTSGGGSNQTTSTTIIPAGAIFAYMIEKAKWKKKGLKKVKINGLEDDQVGLK